MSTLNTRTTWCRPRPPDATRRSSDLTPTEQANVRTAIRFLVKRLGSMQKLAAAMSSKTGTVKQSLRGGVSAGITIRVARVAGVSAEELLAGRWPAVSACPHCGRE